MTRTIRYKKPTESLTKIVTPKFEETSRASVGMEKFVGEYYFISVDKLIPYKNQSRSHFDEIELNNLAETIRIHGIRQPLTIIKSDIDEEKYEVLSGERRLRAAKIAKLEKVPCIILDSSEHRDEIALIENIQRSNLHPIELAKGIKKVVEKFGWGGQAEVSKRLGVSNSRVSEYIKMLDLSEEIQELSIKKNITGREDLLSLLKLSDDSERKKFILEKEKIKETRKNVLTGAFSVLRLSYSHNNLKIQKNALRRLNIKQKEEIRRVLNEILQEIDTYS